MDLGVDLGSFSRIGDNVAWTFTDLDWVDSPGVITGVTQTGGPTAVNISFTSDSITVITPDFSQPPQANTYSFSIQAVHQTVPEPSAVLGLGMLGLGAFASKRKFNQKQD